MKRSLNLLFSLILLSFFAISQQVYSLDLRTGSDLNIADTTPATSTETIKENLYLAGVRVNVSNNSPADLTALSSDITLSGKTEGDVSVVGRDVKISGETIGDLRVVGNNIFISGIVRGDTMIVGVNVQIDKSADLQGDVFIVGGQTNIDAQLKTYSKLVSGLVTINGNLSGNSDITTQKLVFGDSADISGSIRYFSPDRFEKTDNSKVEGQISFNQINSIRDSNVFKKVVLSFINFWMLLQFVTTLILSALLVFVFRVSSQKINNYALNNFGISILIGILSLFIIPVVSVILFVSLIGLPLSILLGLITTIVLTLSWSMAGIVLGTLIKKVFTKKDVKEGDEIRTTTEISFHYTTIGVVLLTVLQFVPFVGEVTRLIFFFVAVGAMMYYLYRSIRFNKI